MDLTITKILVACLGVLLCTVFISVAGIGIAKFAGDLYDERHKHD